MKQSPPRKPAGTPPSGTKPSSTVTGGAAPGGAAPDGAAPGGAAASDVTVELTLEDTGHARTIPDLRLEDTAAQQRRGLPVKGGVVGYNPYDTGRQADSRVNNARQPASEPPPSSRRPTDLRKLSEWIKAQRRAEAVRAEEQSKGETAKPESPAGAPGARTPRR